MTDPQNHESPESIASETFAIFAATRIRRIICEGFQGWNGDMSSQGYVLHFDIRVIERPERTDA